MSLTLQKSVDKNSFQFPYGPGGKYNTRAEAVSALRLQGFTPRFNVNYGRADPVIETKIFKFATLPSQLNINYPTTIIKNDYLGQDGGVVKASQLGFLTINGNGTMIANDEFNAIESFNELKNAQSEKIPLVLSGADFFNQTVIIESLQLSIGSSPNTTNFNFSFIETKVDVSAIKTGFEYDKNRKRRNVAIEGIRFRPTVNQFGADSTEGDGNTDENKDINATTNAFDLLSNKSNEDVVSSAPNDASVIMPDMVFPLLNKIFKRKSPYSDDSITNIQA